MGWKKIVYPGNVFRIVSQITVQFCPVGFFGAVYANLKDYQTCHKW